MWVPLINAFLISSIVQVPFAKTVMISAAKLFHSGLRGGA